MALTFCAPGLFCLSRATHLMGFRKLGCVKAAVVGLRWGEMCIGFRGGRMRGILHRWETRGKISGTWDLRRRGELVVQENSGLWNVGASVRRGLRWEARGTSVCLKLFLLLEKNTANLFWYWLRKAERWQILLMPALSEVLLKTRQKTIYDILHACCLMTWRIREQLWKIWWHTSHSFHRQGSRKHIL